MGNPFYDLTVSYPDDEYLEEAETREGVASRGVVQLREEPVFCWVRWKGTIGQPSCERPRTKDIQNGLKIVLARIEVLNCQLIKTFQSPTAAPGRLNSRITCGVVDHGMATFEVGKSTAVSPAEECAFIRPCGLTAEINTASLWFNCSLLFCELLVLGSLREEYYQTRLHCRWSSQYSQLVKRFQCWCIANRACFGSPRRPIPKVSFLRSIKMDTATQPGVWILHGQGCWQFLLMACYLDGNWG